MGARAMPGPRNSAATCKVRGSAASRSIAATLAAVLSATLFAIPAIAIMARGANAAASPNSSTADAALASGNKIPNHSFAGKLPITDLDQEQAVLHVLDRL